VVIRDDVEGEVESRVESQTAQERGSVDLARKKPVFKILRAKL